VAGIAPSPAAWIGKPPSGNTWNGVGKSFGIGKLDTGRVGNGDWGVAGGCALEVGGKNAEGSADGADVGDWDNAELAAPKAKNKVATSLWNGRVIIRLETIRIAFSPRVVLRPRDSRAGGISGGVVDTIGLLEVIGKVHRRT
jgi:hypothetical protein